ncbi:phosphatase PAP2 family protein [Novosphingobium clariflavum]|uniref:Phosphatase PAP2 family protein n=1 Tax=Novosphingobium clariflavum TaxID=2029884 RepID=A0ABV6SE51_9SPHN|nr:phosphatase PAP2 family protein [Novosphingobium clariflavum]
MAAAHDAQAAAMATALAALRKSGPRLRRHLLVALLVSLCVLSLLMRRAALHIDPWHGDNLPFYGAGLALLILRFGLPRSDWRHAVPVARFSEYAALFTLISLMGATASYPVAALTHGYADAALQRIDLALGFDWLACYRRVAAHPLLQLLGTAAYRSIYFTPAVLLAHAAWTGRQGRAYEFLAAFWLAAVITLGVFSLMPAVGPFSYLWHGAIPYMPESELWQQGLIPGLRAHSVTQVDIAHLRGIVSAPSFHTAAAVLYIAAGWRIAGLRWPIVTLNTAMLLSTPVEGTHYLIDMIIGAAVAGVSLSLVMAYRAMLRRSGAREAGLLAA